MAHSWDSRFDALVFDCDGVILDSASLKRQVFADFYVDEPAPFRNAILAYLARGGGQPRDVKFHHIEGQSTRPVQGIRRTCRGQGCRGSSHPRGHRILAALAYLLSATPQEELRCIIQQRGYDQLFTDIIGAPPDKVSGLLNLITRYGYRPESTVMVGDSYNDYRAVRSNGTNSWTSLMLT